MTEKYPNDHEQVESFEGHEIDPNATELSKELHQKELEYELNAGKLAPSKEKPKVDQELINKTKKEVAKMMENDSKVLSSDKIPSYSAINLESLSSKKREGQKSRRSGNSWRNRLLGFSMVLGGLFGANKDSSGAESKFIKDTTNIESSVQSFDAKKLEKAGVARIEQINTTDTTKDVFFVSLKEYKDYGDIFEAMKKLESMGLTASSIETMDKAIDENPDTFKKWRSLISLEKRTNKLGNPSFAVRGYDKRANSIFGEDREINAGIDSDYEIYGIVVEKEKDTKTANYTDFAKGK